MNYEELSTEYDEDVLILERNHKNNGYYCDGVISINKNLNNPAKNCTLAEELGHHFTTYGDILDLRRIENVKQEEIAKRWAYLKLLPLETFIEAFEKRRMSKYEMMEDLNVTEEFLEGCIAYYRQKFGESTSLGNYTVLFEPTLRIIKWL